MLNLPNPKNSSELDIVMTKFQQLEYGESAYIEKNEFLDLIDYFLTQNEINKATNVLDYAVEFYPFCYEFELSEAQILVESGLYTQASVKLKKLYIKYPNDFGLLMLIGINYAKSGITNKSVSFFEKALESLSKKHEIPVLYAISQTFMQIGRYDVATKYLKKIYKNNPEDDVVLDLAFCFERIEKYNNSKKLYEQYLKTNPFSKLAWYNLGVVYTHLKDNDKAINSFDFAIAIDTKFTSAIFNKANILINTKQYIKANTELEKILELEKGNTSALFLKGIANYKTKNYKEALSNFKSLLKINENQHEAWYYLAKIYYKFNKIKRTKKALYKAINIKKNNSEYWEFAARIYLLDDNYKSADKAFIQAITFAPFEDKYWLAFAEYKAKLKNINEAITILKIGKKIVSDSSIVNLKLKSLHYLQNSNHFNKLEKPLELRK